jgi:hypothetical protein
MIKKAVFAALALVCLVGAVWALRPFLAFAESPQTEGPPKKSRSRVVVDDEATKARVEIRDEVLRLLNGRDFRGLDAMAQKFRESKQIFAQGDWALTFFFTELCDLPEEASEADWQARVQLLRDWFEQDPESITPRIALARGLLAYAWVARGEGWASEVTPEGRRLMHERMAEARRILIAAANLPEKCPAWHSTRLKVALDDGTSRAEYDQIFAEAVRMWPDYHIFHEIRANYLLARWHGEPGEWEAFAAKSADDLGGEQGDVLYAQIVWAMHASRIYGNPIAETALEWARVQRGFEALCRQFPNSLSARSEFCSISGFAPSGARKLMRSMYPLLGNRVDLSIWQTMERYEKDRQWAFSDN